jgi:tetratricopeptide (TPR) repeat protein
MKRFRIAFSFSGRKRDVVGEVAAILAKRFGEDAILYDRFHEAEFARRDLGFHLPKLYHDESELVVVVICADYESNEWSGLEWDAIFDLLKKRRDEDVMLCRYDLATIPGLYGTSGFVDLDEKSPELVATRILERLALNEGYARDHYLSPELSPGAQVEPTDPTTAGESYDRALRCISDGHYDEAIAFLDRAIKLKPTLSYAFYNRGLAYYFKNNDARAIEDFDKAQKLGFAGLLVFRNRANAFLREGNVERALADYGRAIELEPENPLAYLNRGQVYESTLQKKLAIADYETVLRLESNPEDKEFARERLLSLGVTAKAKNETKGSGGERPDGHRGASKRQRRRPT